MKHSSGSGFRFAWAGEPGLNSHAISRGRRMWVAQNGLGLNLGNGRLKGTDLVQGRLKRAIESTESTAAAI